MHLEPKDLAGCEDHNTLIFAAQSVESPCGVAHRFKAEKVGPRRCENGGPFGWTGRRDVDRQRVSRLNDACVSLPAKKAMVYVKTVERAWRLEPPVLRQSARIRPVESIARQHAVSLKLQCRIAKLLKIGVKTCTDGERGLALILNLNREKNAAFIDLDDLSCLIRPRPILTALIGQFAPMCVLIGDAPSRLPPFTMQSVGLGVGV